MIRKKKTLPPLSPAAPDSHAPRAAIRNPYSRVPTRATGPVPPWDWARFSDALAAVNVPSRDDGRAWTCTLRLDALAALLAPGAYRPLHAGRLAIVYAHRDFDRARPAMLLSTHIDSLYGPHHAAPSPWDPARDLLGTFDNSITNAVALDLMLRGALPPQTLIAFTGDEEAHSGGAREVLATLGRRRLRPNLALVLVLDITAEDPLGFPCTLENIFVRPARPGYGSLFRLPAPAVTGLPSRGRRAFAARLRQILGHPALVILNAAADEAWDYDARGQNCLSFCLPSRPHPDLTGVDPGVWMHDDRGVLIARDAISQYSAALSRVCQALGSAAA